MRSIDVNFQDNFDTLKRTYLFCLGISVVQGIFERVNGIMLKTVEVDDDSADRIVILQWAFIIIKDP